MTTMSVRDLPLWKRFTAGANPKIETQVRDELAETLSESQIAELVDMCEADDVVEADAAFRVLSRLPAARLTEALRARWLAAALPVARKHFPRNDLGGIAFATLQTIDPVAAARLLTEEIDDGSLTDNDRATWITNLGANRSAPAIARLAALAERHAMARATFERLAGLSRSQVEAVAAEWRAGHSSKPLSELYWKYIVRLPEGASAKDLRSLLGEPSESDDRIYYYRAVDSDACLVLEEDAEGRLVTWRLGE